jgi:nitrite reductase/ring-hydroxylating ferredoxin subunit
VHYPHSHIGKVSGPAARPQLHHRIQYGLSSVLERLKEAYDSKSALRLPKQILEYSRHRRRRAALPLPYRCHAPHLDSWLGQPMTSLSVWLGVAGVDKDNSLCLYPETVASQLPIGGSQFLGSGVCLPKPTRPNLDDGDLFVFSTDILHSSQLNVSDKTRVALTTRIDPGTPIFSRESLWFVRRWYSANEVLAGHWMRKIVRGSEAHMPRSTGYCDLPTTRCVRIPLSFRVDKQYRIARSDAIRETGKLAVQFVDKRIVIIRSNGELRAFFSRCPHGSYHLEDGYHDGSKLVCPGHGLEFDTRTGRSLLPRYRVAMFKVAEVGGTIFLGPSAESQVRQ